MRDERFEVEDLLAAQLHAVLVKAGEAEDLGLDVDVAVFDKELDEAFEDDVGRDALRQKLV